MWTIMSIVFGKWNALRVKDPIFCSRI